MKPLLIIDETTVDALERKAHAGLASAVLGPTGPWLRHFIRIPGGHLRFEVFAPRAAEPRIRAFLQKQVALGPTTSAARAEYKFQPAEGQHVLKVFDRRAGSDLADDNQGVLGRLANVLAVGGVRPSSAGDRLRQTVLGELTRAVDRLTGPASIDVGQHIRIELLHDVQRWLPIVRDLAAPLAQRATERLQIFHGRTAQVRVSVTQPDGTQPLGADNERLRVAWIDALASARIADLGQTQDPVTPPVAMRVPDPDGTLVIDVASNGRAERPFRLRVTGPKGTATVPLPPRGRVVLSRRNLGAAVDAVGADARLLPRADERCPVLEVVPGTARLVAGGEHPRFSTMAGQPLALGNVAVPAAMRLGAAQPGQDGKPPVTVWLELA